MNRIEKLLNTLDESVDGMLVTNEKNQFYFSEFPIQDGYVLITREKSYLVTDFRYVEAAEKECSPALEVITMEGGFAKTMCALLDENNVKTLAYEDDQLPVERFERFKSLLSGVELVPACGAIARLREFKDEREIESIIKAQQITDDAFKHIVKFIKPDTMTEKEVALELEFYMRSHGASAASFDIIAVSGSQSSLPHGVPRDVKLERGFFTMDFGCVCDGYCSDMTRTVCLGIADADMKRLYNTVREAQRLAIEAIMAREKTMREIDSVARDYIDGAGYKGCFGHGLGHGVGLDIHEPPRLSQSAGDGKLTDGHIVTVEPGIYIQGKYGVRIEDMIAFRNGKPEDITHSDRELIELC